MNTSARARGKNTESGVIRPFSEVILDNVVSFVYLKDSQTSRFTLSSLSLLSWTNHV